MALVGYKVVKEGDLFYYRDLNLKLTHKTVLSDDPLIGKTVWIFKNSWGSNFGDAGYVYVETPITNIGWTHALKTPVTSVVKSYQVICEDRDGDGYFWWGLGAKPATCNCPDTPDGNDADPTLGPLDQYGNCTILSNPPVANFTANNTIITESESVTFADLSSNGTTSWSWTFNGGNPSASNLKNPAVKYDVPGIYDVTLIATNTNGSDTKTITNYVTVNEYIPVYCASNGTTAEEWITTVQLGGLQIISGYATLGYKDYTGNTFTANAGSIQNFVLTPKFSADAKGEYWRIWIDYNGDMDFDDAGELVFTSPLSTGVVSGSFICPANLNITTRMRVSMKRGGAPSPCETFSYGEVEDYTIKISAPVTQPPVASFTGNKTVISAGETVTFSDISTNNPTSWAWTFAGGSPATSGSKNPTISYSSVDYIQNVTIGNVLNISTPGNNYSLSANTVPMVAGQKYSVSLMPKVSANRNYWRIWIDFNGDGDFNDADETLISVNNKKGTFSTSFVIPNYATGTSRMRIAMRTASSVAPCDDNYKGEVEDYPVSFTPAAPSNKSAFIDNIEPEISRSLKIYPNPVDDKLNIHLSSIEPGDFYTIYNLNGQKMTSNKIASTLTTVELTNYSPGIYLIVTVNKGDVFNEKFVKK